LTADVVPAGRDVVYVDRDEAALIFKGIGFVQDVAVGKTLTVANPGTYRIVMVKQPSDDYVLKLVVSNTIRATAEVGPSRSRWIRRRAVAGRRAGREAASEPADRLQGGRKTPE
jgi:hypothetical protein